MSTPTPGHAGILPSPASKKVGPASVSTPMNQYSSPAPRSIPSPAALRKDHAARTPINHPTGSSQGSKTIGATGGATPMLASLSQQGSTASPAAGMLAGFTPTGLGVDLGTPNGVLGTSMAISMSELGLTTSGGMKRNEDEERRIKMRKILENMRRAKGRVSEEGIARVSRRVGFANDIDAEKLSNEERERRVGNRTISIAGNTTVIDVDLKAQKPRSVQVSFSTDLATGQGQSDRAGSILLDDLKCNDNGPLTATLDKFAHNLERLARLDHLSSDKLSCFDALSGMYLSLKRLYEQELLLVKRLNAELSDKSAAFRVLNGHSGRPAMHENSKLGLSLRYWTSSAQPWRQNKDSKDDIAPHSLMIETRHSLSSLYPPIRVSESWLPESFELSAIAGVPPIIPWQDPAPTFLTPDVDSMSDDAPQMLPDIRFLAKLEPPVVVPWQTAANILTVLGSSIPPLIHMPSYLSLLLDLPANTQSHYSAVKEVQRAQTTASGERSFVKGQHAYELNITKHDVGFVLEELPFSHPKQLVELLPTLRQWACMGALLRQSLAELGKSVAKPPEITIEALLAGQLDSSNVVPVELVLSTSPAPTLSVTFPSSKELCYAEIQIVENGNARIIARTLDAAQVTAALEVTQDLSLWIEWIRSRVQ